MEAKFYTLSQQLDGDTINPQRREEKKASCWRWSGGGGIRLSAAPPQCDPDQPLQLGAPAQDTKGALCEYGTAAKRVKRERICVANEQHLSGGGGSEFGSVK